MDGDLAELEHLLRSMRGAPGGRDTEVVSTDDLDRAIAIVVALREEETE